MRKLILAIVFLSLTGCASVATIGLESAVIDSSIRSGRVEATINSIELTDSEKQVIAHARGQYDRFYEQWKAVIKNPERMLDAESAGILEGFFELRTAYRETQEIVRKNWYSYSPAVQARLIDDESHASRLDAAVSKLLVNREYVSSAKLALQYALAIGGIVVAR